MKNKRISEAITRLRNEIIDITVSSRGKFNTNASVIIAEKLILIDRMKEKNKFIDKLSLSSHPS